MFCDFIVSLDLGQVHDYSAITVLQEPLFVWDDAVARAINVPGRGWISPDGLTGWQHQRARACEARFGRPTRPVLDLRHVERLRGLSYPRIVDRVAELLTSGPLRDRRRALVIDHTGVGRGVFDMFVERGLSPTGITITAGQSVTVAPDGNLRVPKVDLVGAVSVILDNERLRVPRTLPEGETLAAELKTFRRRSTPGGSDAFSSRREADHDDLVLSLAMGVWWRDWYHEHLDHEALALAAGQYAANTSQPGDGRVARAMAAWQAGRWG